MKFFSLFVGGFFLVAINAYSDVLARVNLLSADYSPNIPVYAQLIDTNQQPYILSIVDHDSLEGYDAIIIDHNAIPKNYLIASQIVPDELGISLLNKALYNDGRNIIIAAEDFDLFAQAKFSFCALTEPIPQSVSTLLSSAQKASDFFAADSTTIQNIIDAVSPTQLYNDVFLLSGEGPLLIGEEFITLISRHSRDGNPFQKDSQFIYEFFDDLSLNPTYHNWVSGNYSNRNIIASIPGTLYPDDIVVFIAHLDDQPGGPLAHGADDNASGVVAIMNAARIFSQYQFAKTIRFVIVTGEEQGLLGSKVYAQEAKNNEDNILACYNVDMLAWDDNSDNVFDIHTRLPSEIGYAEGLALASNIVQTIVDHDINLIPEIFSIDKGLSDHYSFWLQNYPAIMVIEDINDFNTYYHTTNDSIHYVNLPYFTSISKAVIASVAKDAGVIPLPEPHSLMTLFCFLMPLFLKFRP